MGDRSSSMFSWCGCAATCSIVRSVAARVAPNQTWSLPELAWQSAEPEEPPGKTCAALCRRFSDCELISFETLVKECGNQRAEGPAEGGRTNLLQARDACSSLAAAMEPSEWLYIEEDASVDGYDLEGGFPGEVQGDLTCNEGSWVSAVPSPCHVTRFYRPARARRGKSSR